MFDVRTGIALTIVVLTWNLSWAQTTIDTTNKWAWSSGTGWLNCRTVVTNGSVVSTNGICVGEYILSGYMYSPTVGWIDLGRGNPTNGVRYSNASSTDYGVNHDGKGHLTGYAWNESAGWINFGWTNNPDAAKAPKISLQTGVFSGYAWGGSLGWINLSNMSARLQTVSLTAGNDANSNGIPDAWEIDVLGSTNAIPPTNALGQPTNDYDGDGISNSNEYTTGTSPLNPLSCLALTAISFSGNDLQLIWDSTNTRVYYVDWRTNLLSGAWLNLKGPLASDTATNSTETITNSVSTQGFYRVRATLPFTQ
jgi:hypothetical protein